MGLAIELATQNVLDGKGGPFGAIVVKDGVVVARGANQVTSSNDPTAHAEVVAIRAACLALQTFQLSGCIVYTSCEPCPMCMGALYWARPDKVYYANTHDQAAAIGFDDSLIYSELQKHPDIRQLPMERLSPPNALESFTLWTTSQARIEY
jgi:tRNA(Arg) A34 adenosine deaminase TadA